MSFIAYLSLAALSPSTIGTYLAAVSYAHKVLGLTDPTDHFLVHKLREGLRRQSPKTDTRYPITEDLLVRLCETLGGLTTSQFEMALFRAAFQLAFFGFLRVGEFTASSKFSDCSRIVALEDILFADAAHTVMTLRLRFSKTDQKGKSAGVAFSPERVSFSLPS